MSPSNPRFKHFVKLTTQAKVRRRTGQSVLHGIHLCEAYLDLGSTPKQVVYSQGADENEEVRAVVQRCKELAVDELCMPKTTRRAISGVDAGVGLAFVIDIPVHEQVIAPTKTALFLDAVQNPSNIGALIRTAAAAGVQAVYLSDECASAWSPRALRAGMGGQFAIQIYEACDLLMLSRNATIPIFATALDAREGLYDVDVSGPVVWLFGNEGTGVSSQLLEAATKKIIIPQLDGVESLNVAAAAAVCLFEQRRQQLQ